MYKTASSCCEIAHLIGKKKFLFHAILFIDQYFYFDSTKSVIAVEKKQKMDLELNV